MKCLPSSFKEQKSQMADWPQCNHLFRYQIIILLRISDIRYISNNEERNRTYN